VSNLEKSNKRLEDENFNHVKEIEELKKSLDEKRKIEQA
jgi:hypothetical protein